MEKKYEISGSQIWDFRKSRKSKEMYGPDPHIGLPWNMHNKKVRKSFWPLLLCNHCRVSGSIKWGSWTLHPDAASDTRQDSPSPSPQIAFHASHFSDLRFPSKASHLPHWLHSSSCLSVPLLFLVSVITTSHPVFTCAVDFSTNVTWP